MGNRYAMPTSTHASAPISISNAREAMDLIMEITETKLNEGDYVNVSNCLKVIHETTEKKRPAVVAQMQILNTSMIDPNNTYRLSRDEVIQVMRERYRLYYESCIVDVEETISANQLELRRIVRDKKTAWNTLRSNNIDDIRQYHKQMVRNEKLMKIKINEQMGEIHNMEDILKEFADGNYDRVQL
jgi:hypothetical protein